MLSRPVLIWLGVAVVLLFVFWRNASQVGANILVLALRVAVGGAVIYAADLLGRHYGIFVGVNPVTASIVGLLGVPGVGVLVLWHLIYG